MDISNIANVGVNPVDPILPIEKSKQFDKEPKEQSRGRGLTVVHTTGHKYVREPLSKELKEFLDDSNHPAMGKIIELAKSFKEMNDAISELSQQKVSIEKQKRKNPQSYVESSKLSDLENKINQVTKQANETLGHIRNHAMVIALADDSKVLAPLRKATKEAGDAMRLFQNKFNRKDPQTFAIAVKALNKYDALTKVIKELPTEISELDISFNSLIENNVNQLEAFLYPIELDGMKEELEAINLSKASMLKLEKENNRLERKIINAKGYQPIDPSPEVKDKIKTLTEESKAVKSKILSELNTYKSNLKAYEKKLMLSPLSKSRFARELTKVRALLMNLPS